MTTKKKKFYGMNVGSASMLLIFVVLCLVSFAALSLVSASADRRLTDKIAQRTKVYYEACNTAESSLAAIDKALATQYEKSTSESDYYAAVGHGKSYAIPMDGSQILFVEIKILYPEAEDSPYYEITDWQVMTQ